MKIGYSLLLGEYIEAHLIDYTDCKNFQIVCPSCKEPIFKVVRQKDEKFTDYLSHYEKDKSYVDECELRVGQINSDHILKSNTDSRNQKLKYFLMVLKESIYDNELGSKTPPGNILSIINQIRKSQALVKFKEFIFNYSRRHLLNWSEKDFDDIFDSYLSDNDSFNTTFSIQVQKRIAADIWKHLLSPNARDNYEFLFNYAYFFLLTRFKMAYEIRKMSKWELFLMESMVKIIQTSKEKGFEILQSISNYSLVGEYDGTSKYLIDKFSAEINHEMLGVLLRLPYFEIIENSRTNFSKEVKS